MNLTVTILSLILAVSSLFINYFLQKEQKKIRELERKNIKLESNLLKSLNAIKTYQLIEKLSAEKSGLNVTFYRKKIRKEFDISMNSKFLTPQNINNLIENFKSEI